MFSYPVYVKAMTLHHFGDKGPFPFRLDEAGCWRNCPKGETGNFHGVELGLPYGTPVHAIAAGMILAASYENPKDTSQGLGLRVRQILLEPGNDSWAVVYGFLSDVIVAPGQRVSAGDRIAYSGDSGASMGSKLRLVMTDLRGEFREPKFSEREC